MLTVTLAFVYYYINLFNCNQNYLSLPFSSFFSKGALHDKSKTAVRETKTTSDC